MAFVRGCGDQSCRLPDKSNSGSNNAIAICRRHPDEGPEYVSWRDEGCRLLQCSPRRAAPTIEAVNQFPGDTKINTYYQDLIRQNLDEQQAKYERELMQVVNDRRPCLFRNGSKGAPWRQLQLTTGARGENIMFVDGDVKERDMMKFYPVSSGEAGEQITVREPPRPLPHFYVSNVTLDPNKTAQWLQEREKKNKRSSSREVKTTGGNAKNQTAHGKEKGRK